MRPIEDLIGQLLDVVKIKELEAEIAAREEKCDQLNVEIDEKSKEMDQPIQRIASILSDWTSLSQETDISVENQLSKSKRIEELVLKEEKLLQFNQKLKSKDLLFKQLSQLQDGIQPLIAEREALSEEQALLHKEIRRISLTPAKPSPPDGAFNGTLESRSFAEGTKYGKMLVQWESANKRHEKTRKSKLFAIRTAKKVFEGDHSARIGRVANHIVGQLKDKNMYCPSTRSIKDWLNEAEREGLLKIPSKAHRKGR